MKDLPLDEVADRARSGDSRAQEQLFGVLRVRFLDIAKRRVRRDDIEDVVQETLRVVHAKYRDREPTYGLLSWTMAVLRNVIGNYYQKRERLDRGEPFDEQHHRGGPEIAGGRARQDPSQTAGERTDLVLRSISKLGSSNSRCRRLFQRILESLAEGGSAREISQRTMQRLQEDFPDQTRASLYVVLHRCRNRLRQILPKEEGLAGEAAS
jgi:DNA-directed RNA polymerase specialized sigma24 family protein